MNAHITEAQRIAALVADAQRRADTTEQQAPILLKALRAEPDIYERVMQPHEMPAVMALLRQARGATRSVIWHRPAAPDARARTALIQTNASIYDFPLPTGRRLGDATREEVLEAAADYDARAKANAIKARFLRQVADKLKAGEIVRDALDETTIEGMKK